MPEAAAQAPEEGASPAQPGTYVDPFTAYNFQVEIGNEVVGYFTETSGLGARVEAIQWREGRTLGRLGAELGSQVSENRHEALRALL